MSDPAIDQELIDQLDLIALRMFGPSVYATVTDRQRAEVVWQYFTEMLAALDPPVRLGPCPADFMQPEAEREIGS